jgi:hypothetical protein
MQSVRLSDLPSGLVLARPARRMDGTILLHAGQSLSDATRERLLADGVQEVWVVKAGEPIPDATVPEYMDRYGPNFAAHLQNCFSQALVNRTMQHIFLTSLAHAADCYRRYRLDEDA